MSGAFEQDARALGKVLAAIPEFILVLDRTGKILYINHVDEGYDRDAVIGMQADEIMAPDSRAVLGSVLASVFESGGEQHTIRKYTLPMAPCSGITVGCTRFSMTARSWP